MPEPIEAEGFLFINDPHLASRRPGKRCDRDYAATVLGKLEQAIDIANRERLVPVFGGDMFHNARESDETLKTKLVRVLSGSWTVPFSNVGSHDCDGLRLSDADSLSVIAESGRILKVFRETGPAAEFLMQGVRVGLGFSPARQEIPVDVTGLFPEAAGVVWVTHHDVAFDGAYPGAVDPFEIAGCAMVWNAHMHLEKEQIGVGGTTWFNCGNITRTAIDAIAHEPSVWQFSPGTGMLTRHRLSFAAEVFDLTSRLIDESSHGAADDADHGRFVELLKADLEAAPAATADGAYLKDEILARFAEEKTPLPVQATILSLLDGVVSAAV
jgi:hypothetical protein